MKKTYMLLLSCIIFSLRSADAQPDENDNNPELYHENIAAFVTFLAEKHPTPFPATLRESETASTNRTALKFILHRPNGEQIDSCLRALRAFDWEHGKREDAPEGSKLAGRHAQLLAFANKAAGVTRQSVDSDGNLETTLTRPVAIAVLETLYSQVPGTRALLAEQGHGVMVLKRWKPQEASETHTN